MAFMDHLSRHTWLETQGDPSSKSTPTSPRISRNTKPSTPLSNTATALKDMELDHSIKSFTNQKMEDVISVLERVSSAAKVESKKQQQQHTCGLNCMSDKCKTVDGRQFVMYGAFPAPGDLCYQRQPKVKKKFAALSKKAKIIETKRLEDKKIANEFDHRMYQYTDLPPFTELEESIRFDTSTDLLGNLESEDEDYDEDIIIDRYVHISNDPLLKDYLGCDGYFPIHNIGPKSHYIGAVDLVTLYEITSLPSGEEECEEDIQMRAARARVTKRRREGTQTLHTDDLMLGATLALLISSNGFVAEEEEGHGGHGYGHDYGTMNQQRTNLMVSTAGLPAAKRHCGGVSGVSGETPTTHAVTPYAAGTSQQDGSKMMGGERERGNQGGVETYQGGGGGGGGGGGSGSGSGSGMMVSGGRNDGNYYQSVRVDLQMQLGGVTHLSHPNHPLNDNICSYQRSPETIQNINQLRHFWTCKKDEERNELMSTEENEENEEESGERASEREEGKRERSESPATPIEMAKKVSPDEIQVMKRIKEMTTTMTSQNIVSSPSDSTDSPTTTITVLKDGSSTPETDFEEEEEVETMMETTMGGSLKETHTPIRMKALLVGETSAVDRSTPRKTNTSDPPPTY